MAKEERVESRDERMIGKEGGEMKEVSCSRSVAHIARDKFASLRGHTTRQIGKYEITNGNYQKPEKKYAKTLPI